VGVGGGRGERGVCGDVHKHLGSHTLLEIHVSLLSSQNQFYAASGAGSEFKVYLWFGHILYH